MIFDYCHTYDGLLAHAYSEDGLASWAGAGGRSPCVWSEREELLYKGRVLRLTVTDDGEILETIVVAYRMEHPNGIRIQDGYMYVTQSYVHPVERKDGKLTSCVYRFALDERDVRVTNTLEDPNIFATFVTHNPDCQYGADGIAFGPDGALYVGNFGDGAVYRIVTGEDGSVVENRIFAQDAAQLQSTDGMIFDGDGNLYIADFPANAIAMVTPDGTVTRIAQSPDCTGVDGGPDQPDEPIIWDGRIIASCFDLVTGPDKVNTKHEMPATFADVALMKKAVGDRVRIKAAGGIRTLETALAMIDLGVSRIGSTAGVAIIEELKKK